jgi:Mrp family chromosome partitioning ATPase
VTVLSDAEESAIAEINEVRLARFLAVSPLEVGALDWDARDRALDMMRGLEAANQEIQKENKRRPEGSEQISTIEL